MPIVTTYICDKCKTPQETAEQMWNVAITCEAINQYMSQHHYPTKRQQTMWCRKCVDEMKVFTPLVRADQLEQPPTIENIIQEIVRQTIVGECEGR